MNGRDRIEWERVRQQEEEGHTVARDLCLYREGQLLAAALCYEMGDPNDPNPPRAWPWTRAWWKPTSVVRSLEKAGALYLAERDRLQELANRTPSCIHVGHYRAKMRSADVAVDRCAAMIDRALERGLS